MREKRGNVIPTLCNRAKTSRYKKIHVRMSTGGQIFLGKEAGKRVMGAKSLTDQYSPNMDVNDFQVLHT